MKAPRLTLGLPVFNGERFLGETLDSLLDQSFTDFVLVIADNGSTDGTEEICRRYAASDRRIRYVRHPRNIGAIPNHNFLLESATTELFKWTAADDLYGRDLLSRCIAALDEHPDVVLSHVDKATIDERGEIVQVFEYGLPTDSTDVTRRFHGLVVGDGQDDEYGVIRTAVLRDVRPRDSYHHASRPFMAELVFRGRFHQVHELAYFRREHSGRGDRNPTIPALCANLDPRRAGQSTARLMAEYAYGYFSAVARAPISPTEKLACYRILTSHLTTSGVHRVIRRNSDPLFTAARSAPSDDRPIRDTMTRRGGRTA